MNKIECDTCIQWLEKEACTNCPNSKIIEESKLEYVLSAQAYCELINKRDEAITKAIAFKKALKWVIEMADCGVYSINIRDAVASYLEDVDNNE